MILIDADVLGRERTGDETYVLNLLRELPRVASDLSFGAVTQRPELVPEGVEPIELPARLQEVRMAVSFPRLLRRVRPALAHFQYAIPLGWGGRSVVTIHDLSFEEAGTPMGRFERTVFRTVVPRAARRADHVLTVSERTKQDVVARYGLPAAKVTVTPNGVDPAFTPGGEHGEYVLFVGAVHARKNPLAALDAAHAVGLPLVVAGPEKDARARGRAAARRGRAPRVRLEGAAGRALPGRGGARAAVALRRLRAAGARGDGERDAGRRRGRACSSRGRERRGGLRRRRRLRRGDATRARPSATGWPPPGSSGRSSSPGRRPRGGRPPSIARYST